MVIMSRYSLAPSKPEHTEYDILVGWDGTLGNFFGEVRKPRESDFVLGGEVVISIAEFRCDGPNFADFNHLIKAVSEYAVVDRALSQQLWSDRHREGLNFRSLR